MYSFRLSNCHATKIKMQTWTIRGYVRASKCGATMAWCIRHWNYLIIYMTIEVTGLGNGVDWRRNILGFLMEGKKKEKKRKGGKKKRGKKARWLWALVKRWRTLISRLKNSMNTMDSILKNFIIQRFVNERFYLCW